MHDSQSKKKQPIYHRHFYLYPPMRRPQAHQVAERRHVHHAPRHFMLIPQCSDLFDTLSCFSYFINITLLAMFLCCQVGFLVCGKVLTYRFVSSVKKLLISKKMKKDLFLVSESFICFCYNQIVRRLVAVYDDVVLLILL